MNLAAANAPAGPSRIQKGDAVEPPDSLFGRIDPDLPTYHSEPELLSYH
jgi:hypothetical protein